MGCSCPVAVGQAVIAQLARLGIGVPERVLRMEGLHLSHVQQAQETPGNRVWLPNFQSNLAQQVQNTTLRKALSSVPGVSLMDQKKAHMWPSVV